VNSSNAPLIAFDGDCETTFNGERVCRFCDRNTEPVDDFDGVMIVKSQQAVGIKQVNVVARQ
jgi:hypothetical protein